jgi:hypothetical protein
MPPLLCQSGQGLENELIWKMHMPPEAVNLPAHHRHAVLDFRHLNWLILNLLKEFFVSSQGIFQSALHFDPVIC